MATAGDGRAPYETGGAGGKFRKKPFRRSAPATPYDRPPTALRNNNPGLLTKLVDPASRLIYAGAHKLFGVFRKRLPPLSLQRPPEVIQEIPNVPQEVERNNPIGVSEVNTDQGGISELEQMLKQKTFTRSEIQHLTALLQSRTESPSVVLEPSTSGSLKTHGNERDNFHGGISTPIVNSRVLEKETASPAELAKSYMGLVSRPTSSQTLRQDSKTPITPKIENGFFTPRSRGRSAMYNMARTPYSRSPLNFNQKGTTLAISQSSFEHEGKTALKRRSSVLEDDFGSGGPLRRIRQKNSSFLRDKKELGYITGHKLPEENGDTITRGSVPAKSTETANKIMQQLERLSPKGKSSGIKEKTPSKLTLNMLHGQALRSVEKVDSPKFLPSPNDGKKLEVQHYSKNKEKVEENGESSSKGKEKVEENGGRKFPVPCKMLTVNGDLGKDGGQIVTITDLPFKVPAEPPQKKRAFQMSAPEDTWELDDDIQASIPPIETTKPETISTSVPNKPVSADIIIQPTTPPETAKTPAPVEPTLVVPKVAKIPEKVELKEHEKYTQPTENNIGSLGTPVIEQGFATQIEKVIPEKAAPFQFSGNEISDFKSKTGSDLKVDSTKKVENGNNQKLENTFEKFDSFPTHVFSFGNSQKNSTTPATSPASTPSIFSSLAPFSASSGNNNSSDITPATTTSISIPPPIFGFGSTAPTTSVPETGNTNEKKPESTTTSLFSTTTAATTSGGGLFGFSSPAATSTTTSGGLFGFSAPEATSTTTTATSLFGFSAPAATSTTMTTTTSGALFGFSAPAATSTTTTTTTGGALFGFSASAATSTTTTTTTSGALFGFSAPAATSTTTASGLFGFSSPAAISTSTTAAATSGGSLFGFSSPAATSNAATQSQSSFFNVTSSSQANTQPPPSTTATFQFSSSSSTAPSFGITSENKSSNSTSGSTTTAAASIFGSSTTWQQPPANPSVFSFGASSAATSPFGAANTTATTGSSMFSFSTSVTPSQVFGTPTPVFANNNDQMSMEDSMAEDSMQSPTQVAPFSQTPPGGAPGFMFGSATVAPPQQAAVPFQFGGGQPLQNQAPPTQNPFQSSSVEFNAGSGSFSLGSGGGDKAGRRIVRVNKSKNRRK